MSEQKPISINGVIVADNAGWSEFRIEAVQGPFAVHVGNYFVRRDNKSEWVQVDRETYLAVVATNRYVSADCGIGNIIEALRRLSEVSRG